MSTQLLWDRVFHALCKPCEAFGKKRRLQEQTNDILEASKRQLFFKHTRNKT